MKPRRKPARLPRKLPAPPEAAPSEETPPARRLMLHGMEHSPAQVPDGRSCMVLRLHGFDGYGEQVWFDVGVVGDGVDKFQVSMHQAITSFKEGQA